MFDQRLTVSSSLGVYYQTFMLAPGRWRREASWICGWLFVVGNISITLSVTFGTTLFIVAVVNLFETAPGVGVLAGEPYQVYLIFVGVTVFSNAVSALGNKWLPWLDVRFASPLYRLSLTDSLGGRHFLDLCWCHCTHDLHSCSCEGRPSRRQMGLYPFRE